MEKLDAMRAANSELARAPAYAHYQRARAAVSAMLGEPTHANAASAYWREELAGFAYLWDASPIIIANLRRHCYHLTGLHDVDYREHHRGNIPAFARKLSMLRALDPAQLDVHELPDLAGFGHEIDGKRYNIDTLKFYESMIALARADLLPRAQSAPRTVIEIGAGWGGLLAQIKRHAPRTRCIIVDLPETMLFSGTYLPSVFGEAKVLWLTPDQPDDALRHAEFDFAFVPHTRWASVVLPAVDLAINTVSFQEMTEAQVRSYVVGLSQRGVPAVYSLNRERSRYNREIGSVRALLAECYALETIDMLPYEYGELPGEPVSRTWRTTLKDAVRRWRGRRVRALTDPYRHIIGRLRR
jgi:hypothetical protein